jgi:hypothetical protein
MCRGTKPVITPDDVDAVRAILDRNVSRRVVNWMSIE